jgi:hypothetical protein
MKGLSCTCAGICSIVEGGEGGARKFAGSVEDLDRRLANLKVEGCEHALRGAHASIFWECLHASFYSDLLGINRLRNEADGCKDLSL